MKIGFISLMSAAAWGGSEDLWSRAAKLALEQNHEVFISIFDNGALPDRILKLKEKGAKVFLRKNLSALTYPQLIIKELLNRILPDSPYNDLEKLSLDVIYVSQGDTYSFAKDPYLCKYLKGKKYVLISQLNFESGVVNFSLRNIIIETFINAIKVVFVSKRNLEVAQRQIAHTIENSEIIYNSGSVEEYKIIPYPNEIGIISFASVARLDCNFKGQDILFQIMSSPKWKERSWKLILYGKGKDLEYLKILAQFYGLESRIFFNGHVNNIREVWKDNHILLMPSIAEGSPLSLIEAMLCGRTAVVSDVGGNMELINDNVTGFVSEAPSMNSFDKSLERAWDQKMNWEAMGREANNYVLQNINLAPEQKLLELAMQ